MKSNATEPPRVKYFVLEPFLYYGEDAFERLAAEWNELVRRSATNTPFQLLEYQRSWRRHLGPGDLLTLAVRYSDNRLASIACFHLVDGVLRFNGCVEETDYLDLISPSATFAEAWKTIFDCLTSGGFPHWSVMDLCNIPAASPTPKILPSLASRYDLQLESENVDVCPIIALPPTFDQYLADLNKKQRHEIRRKLRRAEAAGARLKIVTEAGELETAVDDFLHLLSLSSPDKGAWLSAERKELFRDVARSAFEDSILQLMFLELDDLRAAVLFNFVYEDRIWVYNSGLDIERFGRLSAGVVLTARAIEHAILSGYEKFDFLRGDEVYKYRFGARDTELHRIIIRRG